MITKDETSVLEKALKDCSPDANGVALIQRVVKELPKYSSIRSDLKEKLPNYERMQLNGSGVAGVLGGYLPRHS